MVGLLGRVAPLTVRERFLTRAAPFYFGRVTVVPSISCSAVWYPTPGYEIDPKSLDRQTMSIPTTVVAFLALCSYANPRPAAQTLRSRTFNALSAVSSRRRPNLELEARRLRKVWVNVVSGNSEAPEVISAFRHPALDLTGAPASYNELTTNMTVGNAVRGMYNAFNRRNATAASSFLTEDCLYEDMMFGPGMLRSCAARRLSRMLCGAFWSTRHHPKTPPSSRVRPRPYQPENSFQDSRYNCSGMPRLQLIDGLCMLDMTMVIDSIAEGHNTVGIEWHVEFDGNHLPLGRGLTQAKICGATGKIKHVVDIAEAPWRVIGMVTAPFMNFLVRPQLEPFFDHIHIPKPQVLQRRRRIRRRVPAPRRRTSLDLRSSSRAAVFSDSRRGRSTSVYSSSRKTGRGRV
eukprot:1361594-Amorphochlora_amoeboformis.AAC.1